MWHGHWQNEVTKDRYNIFLKPLSSMDGTKLTKADFLLVKP